MRSFSKATSEDSDPDRGDLDTTRTDSASGSTGSRKPAASRTKKLSKRAKHLKMEQNSKKLRLQAQEVVKEGSKKKNILKKSHACQLRAANTTEGHQKPLESRAESVEEKRARWRKVYYKKKALGTLKYQKFLSPKLPPDRECSVCGLVLRTYRSLVQHQNTAHGIPFTVSSVAAKNAASSVRRACGKESRCPSPVQQPSAEHTSQEQTCVSCHGPILSRVDSSMMRAANQRTKQKLEVSAGPEGAASWLLFEKKSPHFVAVKMTPEPSCVACFDRRKTWNFCK